MEKDPILCQDLSSEVAKEVCDLEPEYVEKYHEGKKAIFGYLLGRMMKSAKGSLNPESAKEALQKEIDSRK